MSKEDLKNFKKFKQVKSRVFLNVICFFFIIIAFYVILKTIEGALFYFGDGGECVFFILFRTIQEIHFRPILILCITHFWPIAVCIDAVDVQFDFFHLTAVSER